MKNLGFLAFCFASVIVGAGSQPDTDVNTGVRLPPSIISFWCLSANTYGNTSNYFGAGVSFEFQCQAGGVPAPTYTWKRNGITIVSNGSSVLIVEQPTSGDAGEYVCEAWNEWGTAVSNIITMQMAVISAFPATNKIVNSFQVVEYDPLMLPCQGAPNSVPAPKYAWYRIPNNKPIQTDSRIQIDESGNLYFAYVELRDATGPDEWYTCVLQNSFLRVMVGGSETTVNVSKSTSVVEATVPTVAFYSGPSVSTLTGEQVTLNCFFFGYPTPSIVWQLPNNNQSTYSTTLDGTRLTIDNFQGSDVGEYTCEASNSEEAFHVQVSVNVSIEGAVPVFESFHLQPSNTNVTNGQTVSFICDPAAQPTSTIVWLQNGSPLDVSNLPSNMSISVDRTILTVTDVCKDCPGGATDLMVLQCNATNVYGYAYAEGYLNVLLQTAIVDSPQNQVISGSDSGSVSFTCSATSDPSTPVSITWIYNNSTVDNQFAVSYSVTGDLTSTIITISSAQNYVGTYTCLAWNGYSHAEASATLTVAESPATQTSTATTSSGTGTVPSSTSSRPASTSTGSISTSTSSTSTGVISTSTITTTSQGSTNTGVISTSTSPSSTSTGVISTSTITTTSPGFTSTGVISTSTIIPTSPSSTSTSTSTILSSGTETMPVPSSTVYSSAISTPPSTTYSSSAEHATSGPSPSLSSEPETSSTSLPTSHANHIINISESTSVGQQSPSPTTSPLPYTTSFLSTPFEPLSPTTPASSTPQSQTLTSSFPYFPSSSVSPSSSIASSFSTPPQTPVTSSTSSPSSAPSQTPPSSPSASTINTTLAFISTSISGLSSSFPGSTPTPGRRRINEIMTKIAHIKLMIKCQTSLSTPTPGTGSPTGSESSSSSLPDSSTTDIPGDRIRGWIRRHRSGEAESTTTPSLASSVSSGMYSTSIPTSNPTTGNHREGPIIRWIENHRSVNMQSTTTTGSSVNSSTTPRINRIKIHLVRFKLCAEQAWQKNQEPKNVSEPTYTAQPSNTTSTPNKHNFFEWIRNRQATSVPTVPTSNTPTGGTQIPSTARSPLANMRVRLHQIMLRSCLAQTTLNHQPYEPTSTTVEARHRFMEDRTALAPRRTVSDPTPSSTFPSGSESPTPTTKRHFRLRNFNFCSQA